MKQTCKQNRLPIVTVVLGCCALILRRVLYAVAVDVKNLLPVNHPLEIVLWVLTAIAAAWIIASVWKLDGSAKYEDNFQPSLMAAVGHYIAAAGILLTVLLGFIIERAAYKPLRTAPRMSVMISAIGVSYLLQNLATYVTGGGRPLPQGGEMSAVSDTSGCVRLFRRPYAGQLRHLVQQSPASGLLAGPVRQRADGAVCFLRSRL